MNRARTRILKAGLDALYYSRAHRALAPLARGVGVIFTLHHVVEQVETGFAPNALLEITPDFLETVIERARTAGLDLVSLDEAQRRLMAGDQSRFAVLTFDDGYRDNLEIAYPVLKRHGCPFCIYVTPGLPDATVELWWRALEAIIRRAEEVTVRLDQAEHRLDASTDEAKSAVYEKIYWWLRGVDEDRQRSFVREFADRHGVDLEALCRSAAMSWEEVAELSKDPLVTIGAHTMSHFALAKLDMDRARFEMEESAREIELRIGKRPRHFSYPYGDRGSAGPREFALARRLGFETAVTTRPGVLFPEHAEHLTALPRVSLNGDYQDARYLDLFFSGTPFALFNGFRRVNAA